MKFVIHQFNCCRASELRLQELGSKQLIVNRFNCCRASELWFQEVGSKQLIVNRVSEFELQEVGLVNQLLLGF